MTSSEDAQTNINIIFSDVLTNYTNNSAIRDLTNFYLDEKLSYFNLSNNLVESIEQLSINIYVSDAINCYNKILAEKEKGLNLENIPFESRINRFNNAFQYIFDKKLRISGVDVDIFDKIGKSIYFENSIKKKFNLVN